MESEIARVTTEAEMTAAFTNRNIKFISIEADFVFTSGTSNGPTSGAGNSGNDQNTTIASSNLTNRTLIIEGNDHVIDSRSRSYFFSSTSTFELHIQNLTAFAGNWYGPFSSRGGKQVFHNFTNIGTQMLNAPSTDVTLSVT